LPPICRSAKTLGQFFSLLVLTLQPQRPPVALRIDVAPRRVISALRVMTRIADLPAGPGCVGVAGFIVLLAGSHSPGGAAEDEGE
jgi:hypothetical protein